MKQPKKPTLIQKRIMRDNGLNWHNWSVIDASDGVLTIYNKISGKKRKIKK